MLNVRQLAFPTAAMKAEVVSTDTPASFKAAVLRATELLRAGEVVALPTETVYGLGADGMNPQACARIFEIKKRPRFDPLILHAASLAQAKRFFLNIPRPALKLMKKFWPGPLTLVLPKPCQAPAALH